MALPPLVITLIPSLFDLAGKFISANTEKTKTEALLTASRDKLKADQAQRDHDASILERHHAQERFMREKESFDEERKRANDHIRDNIDDLKNERDFNRQDAIEAQKSEKESIKSMVVQSIIHAKEKLHITEAHYQNMISVQNEFNSKLFYVAQSIYNSQDQRFKEALTILDNIINDGTEAFNAHLNHADALKKLEAIQRDIYTENTKINNQIAILNYDIDRFNNDLVKEEAKYDKTIEFKDKLDNVDFDKELVKMSIAILKIADTINAREISLLKIENEKELNDEKLNIINDQIDLLKRKDFDALSSIKASFYAQKKVVEISDKSRDSVFKDVPQDFLSTTNIKLTSSNAKVINEFGNGVEYNYANASQEADPEVKRLSP